MSNRVPHVSGQNAGGGSSSVTLPIAESDVTSLVSDLALKAPLASPTFTGTPSLPTGTTATTQTATVSNTTLATTAYVMAKERAFVLGKAGAIGATETDAADFLFIVPFDCTMLRMKSTLRTAASGSAAVQLRTAAGPITNTVTWGNVASFVTTFSSGNYVAVVDPANVNASEGDVLGFSVGTGSGTDLLVEVVVVLR